MDASNKQDRSPLETLRRLREEASTSMSSQSTSEPMSDRVNTLSTPRETNIELAQSDKFDIISKIQYGLLLFTLLILPSFILPLPWGWAEYGKGSLLIVMTVLLATLEVMKILLNGKFSMIKGFLDISLLLVLGSFLASTLFSSDLNISLYGFDNRLGTGFVAILAMFVFFVVVKSFIKDTKSLQMLLLAAVSGISLSALLSIFSFLGVNLLGFIGSVDNLFVPGFPLVASAAVGMVLWGVGIMMKQLLMVLYGDESPAISVLLVILGIIDILAIGFFSLNQGNSLTILIALSLLSVFAIALKFRKELKGTSSIMASVLTVLFFVIVGVLHVPSVKTAVVESTEAITQVSLSGQLTWQIVTSTLSESVGTGLVGLGVDTFSIYYNIYKPAFSDNFDLTDTNFTFGNSEILTTMGNRGITGALVWLVVGVLIVYQLIRDFSSKGEEIENYVAMIMLDVILVSLFIASFFVYYGFILYFMMFLLLSSRILLGALLNPNNAESFVMKLDLLVEKVGATKNNFLPIGLAVVAALIGVFMLSGTVTKVGAAMKVLRAEDRIIEVREEIAAADADRGEGDASNYTFEQREEALSEIANLYLEAINIDTDNSQYHRRRVLILVDYMNLLVEQATSISAELEAAGESTDPADNEDLAGIQELLNRTIEIAIEEGRSATELAPNVFANWDARGYIYSQLVGLKLTNYVDSGIAAVDRAVSLNPSSYTSYYRGAELFVAQEDFESAGGAVSRALEINPNHIPSLLLASELSIAAENYDTAKALLTRTQEILVAIGAEETETYALVEKRLADVDEAAAGGGALDEALDPDQLPGEEEDLLNSDEFDTEGADLPEEPVDTGLGEEDQETTTPTEN